MEILSATTAAPHVYPPDPSGRCIYCGTPTPAADLSREHIIPFGLGGGLILLQASCGDCARITSKIEQACLREMFLAYRTHFALPTYRKKNRPRRLPITFNFGTHREKRYLRLEDHPTVLAMPRLPRARISLGLPPGPLLRVDEYMMFGDRQDITRKMRGMGIRAAVIEDYFKLDVFAQTLAKIAHSFVVAELGFDNFVHFLTDIILKNDRQLAAYLIGGLLGVISTPEDVTGQVYLGFSRYGADWHAFATIKLFALHDTPAYSVVVGKILPTPDLITRCGQRIRAALLEVSSQHWPDWLPDRPS